MLKQFLLGSVLFLGALLTNGVAEAKSGYANYYSTTAQTVATAAAVSLENTNASEHFRIIANNEIEFHYAGAFQIIFTATGGQSVSAAPAAGPWSLGLFLNGVLVPGSVAAVSGTDVNALEIVGQVIIEVAKGDLLQLINTTSGSIYVTPSVSGGTGLNNSASIQVVKLP